MLNRRVLGFTCGVSYMTCKRFYCSVGESKEHATLRGKKHMLSNV